LQAQSYHNGVVEALTIAHSTQASKELRLNHKLLTHNVTV